MWLLITYLMVTIHVLKEFRNVLVKLFPELGWESLQARRERWKLFLFADIVHGNAPSYLQQDLPPSIQLRTQNRYQLRNRSNLSQFHTRTETFRNSFFPSTTNNWNFTDETIKNIDDRNNLESYLYRSLPNKISYFYMYSRRINITLAIIRMQCSELLYHLYQNHVADSPNCPFGVIETPEHYFFVHCPTLLGKSLQLNCFNFN